MLQCLLQVMYHMISAQRNADVETTIVNLLYYERLKQRLQNNKTESLACKQKTPLYTIRYTNIH